MKSLKQMADERRSRLTNIFRRDKKGRRPVCGRYEKRQTAPHSKDHILFYAYFAGENGRGLGASPQTGGSGLVAKMSAELQE